MLNLTTEQKLHIHYLKVFFSKKMERKYRRGVEEHGGNLWEKDTLYLIEQAIMENIDQFIYLVTAREKIIKNARNF